MMHKLEEKNCTGPDSGSEPGLGLTLAIMAEYSRGGGDDKVIRNHTEGWERSDVRHVQAALFPARFYIPR